MSSPGQAPFRFESIDGYRALAAIAVVVYHVGRGGPATTADGEDSSFVHPDQLGAHIIDNLGNYGVAAFFLLSGLVIFRPFVAASMNGSQRPATAPYLIRRALRIFPGYWIALIGWALTTPADQHESGTAIGKLLLIDAYDSNLVWLAGIAVSWTLTIEIAFYLFLPAYAFVVGRLAVRHAERAARLRVHFIGLALLYVSAYAFRILLDNWSGSKPNMLLWLPAHMDWFAVGMLLATLSVWVEGGGTLPAALHDFARRTGPCLFCAALCFSVVVVLKGDQLGFARSETMGQTSWRFFFQGLSAFFLLLPAVLGDRDHDQRWARILRAPTMVLLGTISYGIYLWHFTVLSWYEGILLGRGPWIRLVGITFAVLCVTIPIAAASYYVVERPILRLFRKWSQDQQVSPAIERVDHVSVGSGG